MNNVVSAAYKSVQPNRTQMYLRSQLVADVITKAEFGNVSPAQNIKFPYGNSVVVQDYGYQAGNARTDMTLVGDSYNIDQVKTAVMGYDKIQNLAIQNPTWTSDVEQEMGYQLARNVDQTVIQKGITNAFVNVAAGAITAGGLLKLMAETDAKLTEAERMAGEKYWIMDALRAALLPQMDASSGFARADDALVKGMNGFNGNEAVGFKILVSNNLKYTLVLTATPNPTNGMTLTLGNFTFTFVTTGTATNPGEVSLGANAAATEVNLKDAINGTGVPGASTYIDFSADDRTNMKNSQLTISAFVADVATITKYGRINASSTTLYTLGTETSDMLAGVMGAMDMTMVQTPVFEELPANVAAGSFTHAKDMGMTTFWGAGVWFRRKRSLARISFNA